MRWSGRRAFGWLHVLALALLACATAAPPARGVILYSRPDRNTSPPTGALAGSGWQWQGQFGAFLGTPIAREYFITSGHIGGAPGQPFFYNGQAYRTVAFYDDPQTDLRIWKVDGTFPTWAPLFTDPTETGRSCTLFGRGTQRGEPIYVNDQLKGWAWGPGDGAQSWGRNAIEGIVDGGPTRGDLLYFSFDQMGTADEGTLSAGDSGGGLFVRHGRTWKLAGINTSVDGPYAYSNSPDERTFNASIFDKGGLHVRGLNEGHPLPDLIVDNPAGAYATRISSNIDWINAVVSGRITPGGNNNENRGIPEPTGAIITLVGLATLALRRRRRPVADP